MKKEKKKRWRQTKRPTVVDKKLGRTFSQVQGQSSQPLSSFFLFYLFLSSFLLLSLFFFTSFFLLFFDFFPLDLFHFPSTFPLQKKESSNIYNGTLSYWKYRLVAFNLEWFTCTWKRRLKMFFSIKKWNGNPTWKEGKKEGKKEHSVSFQIEESCINVYFVFREKIRHRNQSPVIFHVGTWHTRVTWGVLVHVSSFSKSTPPINTIDQYH